MSHPFPPPPIKSLERLQAADGLLINAERWHQPMIITEIGKMLNIKV